ncbi:TetR family transcriptional regulator [Luteimicrobium sp. NPDC057192]|uniref:TetR/AcrR family transcriptional regulator n=1 Tax=Luteimicrobium sp. NPDC057192 TaxID=3346042 RepID=UPI0036254835
MRSAPPDDDLTARARIRDAAIARFAADGFRVGVRTIAADADVSPGLVIHHFRSKEGLRRACDEHVLEQIHEARAEALLAADPAPSILRLAADEHYAWLATYLLRSLQAGGDLARRFVADLVTETRDNLEEGVASGSVRPSRDPDARAEQLTMMSLGYLLLAYALEPESPTDLASWVVGLSARGTLPGLEVFTEGLFTDRRFLDAFLAQDTTHPTPARTTQEDR